MTRPSFRSHENDLRTYPARPSEALDDGWDINLTATPLSLAPHEYGSSVHFTSSSGEHLNIERAIGPIKVAIPVETPLWEQEGDGVAWGWDANLAVIDLGHEAVKNASRLRKRDLTARSTEDYGLVVTDVVLQHLTKRKQILLVAQGSLCVRRLTEHNVLDLTGEMYDATRAIAPFANNEDSLGVSLCDARSLDIEVIAALIRRPEVEAFAGARYDPNRLIDDVQDETSGRDVYVALRSGRPFGFISLTDRMGSIALMCLIIADGQQKGQHLSPSMFEQGLQRAWAIGYRTVVGLTEPPCYMKESIERAGGGINLKASGLLEWRVDLLDEDVSDW